MPAELAEVFVNRVKDLKEQSETVAKAETGREQRVWMVPSDWPGDPFAIDTLHVPSFDRTKVNEKYQEVHQGNDSHIGDATAMKIQLGYLSAMERAFRSRYASHIRNVTHAAARHAGHGHDQGVFAAVQNYAQDLIKAAGA